jgi:hypothetical protein
VTWKPRTRAGRYVKGLLLGLDQLGNTIWAGDEDETISSRLGKLKALSRVTGRPMRPGPRLLAWILNRIEDRHVEKAIEYGEGADAIADREAGAFVAMVGACATCERLMRGDCIEPLIEEREITECKLFTDKRG